MLLVLVWLSQHPGNQKRGKGDGRTHLEARLWEAEENECGLIDEVGISDHREMDNE